MLKLIMTRGLPGSGKSTWAREQVRKSNGLIKRINKDDLRAMLDDGKYSRSNEKTILTTRDALVVNYLGAGLSVIVDDTNLAPKHEEALANLAKECGATFEVKSFLDVPLETCIERDLKRPVSVGEKVIKKMHGQFINTSVPVLAQDESLPAALIVDIDGTLAHMAWRSPYDYSKVLTDKLDRQVATLVEIYRQIGYKILIVSGRNGSKQCYDDTVTWLSSFNIHYDMLAMRRADDMRNDAIVKREIFDERIRGKYYVEFVLDDRDRVVDMWRNEIGLKVFQVAEGDF